MLWGGQDAAEAMADLVDPAAFQTKCSRSLFLLFAREAPNGFSHSTIRAAVQAEAPHCAKLLDELKDWTEDSSHQALAESLVQWGQVERLRRAAANVEKDLNFGGTYREVRAQLDRQLSAIDLSALSDKSYDDKRDMARRIEEFISGSGPAGLPFGFRRLDEKVTPMLDGNLIIVAGRPGVGKTTIMKNIARNAVRLHGIKTAYSSLEMKGEEMLPSFACMDAGLSYIRYIRRLFTAWELKAFREALDFWVNTPLFILNERSAVTPDSHLRTMKRYVAEGVRLHVHDHLHRFHYDLGPKRDPRVAHGEFARQIKSFGVDNSCIEIAGAQFTKGDKHEEPNDEMIKETNTILEEADKIILPWLPKVAGTRAGDGSFLPTIMSGGRRIFAREAPKGSDEGEDKERVYMKLGKMRVRDDDGFVAIPFNPESGLMFEDTIHQSAESAA